MNYDTNSFGTDITGSNQEEVRIAIADVIKAYNDLYDALNNTFQHSFIDAMANLWACNEAKRFFADVKTDMDSIISETNLVFESVVKAMNDAADIWSNAAGSSFARVSFTTNPSSINVENIREEINGVQGVSLTSANSTSKLALEKVNNDVESAISKAKLAVVSNGFKGGNQSENLQKSLEDIGNAITNIIRTLSENVYNRIQETVELYGDIAAKVSNAFAGTEG